MRVQVFCIITIVFLGCSDSKTNDEQLSADSAQILAEAAGIQECIPDSAFSTCDSKSNIDRDGGISKVERFRSTLESFVEEFCICEQVPMDTCFTDSFNLYSGSINCIEHLFAQRITEAGPFVDCITQKLQDSLYCFQNAGCASFLESGCASTLLLAFGLLEEECDGIRNDYIEYVLSCMSPLIAEQETTIVYCNTGESIRFERLCDGKPDCPDGEDEESCPDFLCMDGSVIDSSLLCKSKQDCADNSDEAFCTTYRK